MISSTAAVIGQAIASLGKMWWGFILNSVWALALLLGAALLVPNYGALGLAGAFLASVFSACLHQYIRTVPLDELSDST